MKCDDSKDGLQLRLNNNIFHTCRLLSYKYWSCVAPSKRSSVHSALRILKETGKTSQQESTTNGIVTFAHLPKNRSLYFI